jgi:hypothetical protein
VHPQQLESSILNMNVRLEDPASPEYDVNRCGVQIYVAVYQVVGLQGDRAQLLNFVIGKAPVPSINDCVCRSPAFRTRSLEESVVDVVPSVQAAWAVVRQCNKRGLEPFGDTRKKTRRKACTHDSSNLNNERLVGDHVACGVSW